MGKENNKLTWSQAAYILTFAVALCTGAVGVIDRINVSQGKPSISETIASTEVKKDIEYIKAAVTEIKDSVREHTAKIAQLNDAQRNQEYRIMMLERQAQAGP